ncbi:MAG: stilbene synthase [Verrucomicrobia bacterium]|nr:stilbene synthase [Verrucomicrobiota bacterium]
MFIVGLGTAAPPHRYSQQECWEALQVSSHFALLRPRSQAILRKVLLGDNGVETRHLCLNSLGEAFRLHPDDLHARFAKNAPALAAQAAERALDESGAARSDIDALLISTCTGYLCPGLTSYVSERLGLRADVVALDLVGQGCGAAIPNLRTAHALLASGQCRCALSICVEVCSAAFYLDDDPGVLVSACLFGDGAGAAVVSNQPYANRRRIRWLAASSALCPADRDLLRFELKGGMLRNILSLRVPEVSAQQAEAVLARTLGRAGVDRNRVATWILHAGGRDVLLELRERLKLEEKDLRWSAQTLRDFGNVSSPSVLFALEAACAGRAPTGYWWLSAFGAGFTCHGALLEVEEIASIGTEGIEHKTPENLVQPAHVI